MPAAQKSNPAADAKLCYNIAVVNKYRDQRTPDDEIKKEIDGYRPLKQRQLDQLKEYYRVGLTYSSNALEGNSLTETETKIVLEDGITIGGKPLKDHYEAVGHAQAYDLLYTLANTAEITEQNILSLHELFYQLVDAKKAGKYRQEKVIITGTEFVPPSPQDVPGLMRSFSEEILAKRKELHPVHFAAWLHLRLVTIHPFEDGNGRAARLLMNLSLLQSGYVITIIPPVLRNDYNDCLREAQVKKNEISFFNFISEMVYESEKDYLRMLRALS